jgi:hypothetical protein
MLRAVEAIRGDDGRNSQQMEAYPEEAVTLDVTNLGRPFVRMYKAELED